MTISNQAEQQIMSQQQQQGRAITQAEDDPLAALLPEFASEMNQPGGSGLLSGFPPQPMGLPVQASGGYFPSQAQSQIPVSHVMSTVSIPCSTQATMSNGTPIAHSTPTSFIHAGAGPVLSTPASTTLVENAATAKKILEEYIKMNAVPPHRKDMNYNFPPGLFPSEVDLEGSQRAYENVLRGLDNPDDFQRIFNQIEADPFHQQNIFGDIDLGDVFD